jgi:hypothetical protein
MKRWILVLVVLWLSSATIEYGLDLAYWQRGWFPLAAEACRKDKVFSATRALVRGPLALLGGLWWRAQESVHGPQGLLYRCLTPEEIRAIQAQRLAAPAPAAP